MKTFEQYVEHLVNEPITESDLHHTDMKEGDQLVDAAGEKHEYIHTTQGLGRKVVHFSSGLSHPTNKTGHLVGFKKTGVNFKLNETHKLGNTVMIHKGSAAGKVGTIGEIRHGLFKGAAKTYTVDYDHNPETGHSKSIQLPSTHFKAHQS